MLVIAESPESGFSSARLRRLCLRGSRVKYPTRKSQVFASKNERQRADAALLYLLCNEPIWDGYLQAIIVPNDCQGSLSFIIVPRLVACRRAKFV